MELQMSNNEAWIKHSLHSPSEFISLRSILDEGIKFEFDEELFIIAFLQSQNHTLVKINNCYGFSQN